MRWTDLTPVQKVNAATKYFGAPREIAASVVDQGTLSLHVEDAEAWFDSIDDEELQRDFAEGEES